MTSRSSLAANARSSRERLTADLGTASGIQEIERSHRQCHSQWEAQYVDMDWKRMGHPLFRTYHWMNACQHSGCGSVDSGMANSAQIHWEQWYLSWPAGWPAAPCSAPGDVGQFSQIAMPARQVVPVQTAQLVVATGPRHSLHQRHRRPEESIQALGCRLYLQAAPDQGILGCDPGRAAVGVADPRSNAADGLDCSIGQSDAVGPKGKRLDAVCRGANAACGDQGYLSAHAAAVEMGPCPCQGRDGRHGDVISEQQRCTAGAPPRPSRMR